MDNLIIYVISDSVGETAEQVTKAALSQFSIENDCEVRRFPDRKSTRLNSSHI